MDYETLNIPKHVAIILDGNGRWAVSKGLKRSAGHLAGYENLKKLSEYILSRNIKVLSLFVFSTDNFKRSEEEVKFLMDLFVNKFKKDSDFFKEKNIKVVFSGRKEPLSNKVYKAIIDLADKTKDNDGGILNICLNYGGQSEIVDACKKLTSEVLENKINLEDINEDLFSSYLYQDLIPIDFLIRTSGEQRISNFMLFQLAYAEIYFADVNFPDFNQDEFDKAMLIYNKRDRRYGGIKDETKNN